MVEVEYSFYPRTMLKFLPPPPPFLGDYKDRPRRSLISTISCVAAAGLYLNRSIPLMSLVVIYTQLYSAVITAAPAPIDNFFCEELKLGFAQRNSRAPAFKAFHLQ